MVPPMLPSPRPDLEPSAWLESAGTVFACFDRQDSGNVSFGVEADGWRYFVKTAGPPGTPGLPLAHTERIALLDNAERLARSVSHPALTRFLQSTKCALGRALIYEWADGEHLHAKREHREDPATAWQRFLHLPLDDRLAVVRALLDLHVALAAKGWVTGDFYDGCLLYDFERKRVRVCDLDSYRPRPYRNTMGRMFGSTRFMAPEEFKKGRLIDERTTVFALGRTIALFLGNVAKPVMDVAARATAEAAAQRHPTVAALAAEFVAAVSARSGGSAS